MLKQGDKVSINGIEYTLGTKIGGGLEGNVFNIDDKTKENVVIKVINDDKMSKFQKDELYNHLKWLTKLRNRYPETKHYMALPSYLLDNKLGYVMPKAKGYESLNNYINAPSENEEFESWLKDKYTLKRRYKNIIQIFKGLREIHCAGLIFTDLSPNNILVREQHNGIVFIDTDNTRQRDDAYLSVLGTPGYMAPELLRKSKNTDVEKYNIDPNILSKYGKLTPETDIFSAAVIAFELLTLNHPFVGDIVDEGSAELEEKAKMIETDYIFKEGTENTSTTMLTPFFNNFTTKEIRKLFYRTFVDSVNNPDLRPTDSEFIEAFQKGLDLIVECETCGYSQVYDLSSNNLCINCQERIEKQLFLNIYNVFHKVNRNEIINQIGNYPQYNLDYEDSISDNDNNEINNFKTCKLIIPSGEKNYKFLYNYHFDLINDINSAYIQVTYNKENKKISLYTLQDNPFGSPCLVDKANKQLIPLNKGKEFSYKDYDVIFETKAFGNGYIQIICKFEVE